MTKEERIMAAFNHLVSIKMVRYKSDVAAIMGRNRTAVTNAINGKKRDLSELFLKDFARTFKDIFNTSWIIKGEGNMLASPKDSTTINNTQNKFNTYGGTTVQGTYYNNDSLVPYLQEKLKEAEERSKGLERENTKLLRRIDELIDKHTKLLEEYSKLLTNGK